MPLLKASKHSKECIKGLCDKKYNNVIKAANYVLATYVCLQSVNNVMLPLTQEENDSDCQAYD